MTEVCILLGAPNEISGRLSRMARYRADAAMALLMHHPSSVLVLTGGKGRHFNTSPKPHVTWMANHLVSRGVNVARIFGAVLSANTVEDAIGSRLLLGAIWPIELTIITSRFHAERASFVFQCAFSNPDIRVAAADDGLFEGDYMAALDHERKALESLRHQGGVVAAGRLLPHPTAVAWASATKNSAGPFSAL